MASYTSWRTTSTGVAGRGRRFCPSILLPWNPTWSIASSSGVSSTRDMHLPDQDQGRTMKIIRGLQHSCKERLWELGLFCLEMRRLQGRPHYSFQHVKEAYWRHGDRLCSYRRRAKGFKLKVRRFRMNIRKTHLWWGWWNTGTGCPQLWIQGHSERALSNPVQTPDVSQTTPFYEKDDFTHSPRTPVNDMEIFSTFLGFL